MSNPLLYWPIGRPMDTCPEMMALWSLALRGATLADLLRYLEHWPFTYRPRAQA